MNDFIVFGAPKISEDEINFWNRRGLSPNYMYELADENWETFIN